MSHVTVLKIMIDGTPSFSYHTFMYPASFTVVAGKHPHVHIESHGDRREDNIPITGDVFIMNGDGALITSASYAELIGRTVPERSIPCSVRALGHPKALQGIEPGLYQNVACPSELTNPQTTIAALEYLYQTNPDGKFVVGLFLETVNDAVGYVFIDSKVHIILREDGWAIAEGLKRTEAMSTTSKNWMINSPDLYFYRATRQQPGLWDYNIFQLPGTAKMANRLTTDQLMKGWGVEAGKHLACLMSALVIQHGFNSNYLVGVLDSTNQDNTLHAIVYVPDENNKVRQVVGVVKEDMGVFIGALTTKVLGELNIGVDGAWFGHYGDIKLYQAHTSNDISFTEIPVPSSAV